MTARAMALVFMGLAAAVAFGCGSGGVSGRLDATADTTVAVDAADVAGDVVGDDTEAAVDGADSATVTDGEVGDGDAPEVDSGADVGGDADGDAVADTVAAGGPLALPLVVEGNVDAAPDAVRRIRFVGAAGTWVAVMVTATGPNIVEPRIELAPEAGTGLGLFRVAESASALTTRVFLPRDGVYALAVSDRRNAVSQAFGGPGWEYRVEVAVVGSPVAVIPVTLGLPLRATLGAGGDEAVALATEVSSVRAVVTVAATEPVGVTALGPSGAVEGVGAGSTPVVVAGGGAGLRTVIVEAQDPDRVSDVQVVVHAVAAGADVEPGDGPVTALAAGPVGVAAIGKALEVMGQAGGGVRDVFALTADAGLELRILGLDGAAFRATLSDDAGAAMVPGATSPGEDVAGVVPAAGGAPGVHLLAVGPRGDGGAYEAIVVAQRCGARGGAVPAPGSLRVSEVLPAPAVAGPAPAGEDAGACGDAQADGVIGPSDAFVELLNVSAAPVELGGVTAVVGGVRRFRFPCGAVLWPRQAAVVFAGGEASPGEAGGTLRGALVMRVPGAGGLGLERANLSGRALVIAGSDGAALDTVTLPAAPAAGFSLVRTLSNPSAGLKAASAEGGCGEDDALVSWGYTPGAAPGGVGFAPALPAPAVVCAVAPLATTGRGRAEVSAGPPGGGCGANLGPVLAYAVDLAAGARLRVRATAASWNPTLSLASACAATECLAAGASTLDFVAPDTARYVLWIAGAHPEDRGACDLDLLVTPP